MSLNCLAPLGGGSQNKPTGIGLIISHRLSYKTKIIETALLCMLHKFPNIAYNERKVSIPICKNLLL